MKRQFVMTIEVDEKNIAEKYPNWRWNFGTPEEFINHIADSKREVSYQYPDTDGTRTMWNTFGYKVTVKKI